MDTLLTLAKNMQNAKSAKIQSVVAISAMDHSSVSNAKVHIFYLWQHPETSKIVARDAVRIVFNALLLKHVKNVMMITI